MCEERSLILPRIPQLELNSSQVTADLFGKGRDLTAFLGIGFRAALVVQVIDFVVHGDRHTSRRGVPLWLYPQSARFDGSTLQPSSGKGDDRFVRR